MSPPIMSIMTLGENQTNPPRRGRCPTVCLPLSSLSHTVNCCCSQCTPTSCSCPSYTSYTLPCWHILSVRQHTHQDEVNITLVAARWRIYGVSRTNTDNNGKAESVASDVNVAEATVSQRFRILTLTAVLSPVASTLV